MKSHLRLYGDTSFSGSFTGLIGRSGPAGEARS